MRCRKRFNRTFMELKQQKTRVYTLITKGFNRTFMELKRVYYDVLISKKFLF